MRADVTESAHGNCSTSCHMGKVRNCDATAFKLENRLTALLPWLIPEVRTDATEPMKGADSAV